MVGNQKTKKLAADEYFGHSVDSGTGCSMSPEAGQALSRMIDVKDDYLYSILGEEMEKTYIHTRSWLYKIVDDASGANLVAFSSGVGDGCYPSFFGLSGDNKCVCLVTDFLLFGKEQ